MLPEGAEARSGMRHGPLGRELRLRAELQPALASLRPARAADGAVGILRRHAGRARARREREPGRAGDDPRPARALSPARGDRGHGAVGQGLHERDAQGLRGPSRRSRGARGLCRVDHERDALADVGPALRQARRGRRHRGMQGGAGIRLRQHPGCMGPPGPPAPLRPPDGDVALPAAGAARGRPAARAGAGRRAPDPHADAHRRPVRALPRRPGLQPEGDGDRPQVPRLFGRSGRLPGLRHPQLPLRDLRRDVPRPVHAGDRGGRGADRTPSPRRCCASSRRRWPISSRAT